MANIYSRNAAGGGRVSRKELLDEIERLRAEMNSLATAGADYTKVLEVSRRLDELIVKYYRGVALDSLVMQIA